MVDSKVNKTKTILDNINRSYKLASTSQFSQKWGGLSDKTERQTLIPLLTHRSFLYPLNIYVLHITFETYLSFSTKLSLSPPLCTFF